MGNDIVVIVFHEGGSPFDPAMMKTRFNRTTRRFLLRSSPTLTHTNSLFHLDIYAVVCVDTEATAEEKEKNGNGGRLRVRVEFSSKEGVRPYGPQLPPSRTYCLDDNFRKFFLSKRMSILPLSLSLSLSVLTLNIQVINGERAALHAPVFAQKLQNTRKALLEELVNKYK